MKKEVPSWEPYWEPQPYSYEAWKKEQKEYEAWAKAKHDAWVKAEMIEADEALPFE